MSKDDRDVLEVMKAELDFVEKGGYGRSVRTPWKPTCIFQDSPTCLNFDDPKRTHSCDECLLMEFVPPASRTEQVPCHQIPLTPSGETLESMEQKAHQDDLEQAVKNWLHTNISRIEAVRAQLDASLRLGPEKLLPPPSDRKRLLRRRRRRADADRARAVARRRRLRHDHSLERTGGSSLAAPMQLRLHPVGRLSARRHNAGNPQAASTHARQDPGRDHAESDSPRRLGRQLCSARRVLFLE